MQLDTALRDQNTEVRSYVLDNANAEWLGRLEAARDHFRTCLEQTWATANTELERELLKKFENGYEEFDRACDEIIALCRKGDRQTAKKVALRGLPKLYQAADGWCDEFIELVAEAQRYKREDAPAETKSVDNELRAVQSSLHFLMKDVARSRALAERKHQQLAQAEHQARWYRAGVVHFGADRGGARGRLVLESTSSSGTSFGVVLPIPTRTEAACEQGTIEAKASASSLRLLWQSRGCPYRKPSTIPTQLLPSVFPFRRTLAARSP